MVMKINPEIFRAYDVRGIYPDEINPELAYKLGWAFGEYLKHDLKKSLPLTVAVGLDMRGSSPFLAREVIKGLVELGVDVADLGKVPTPAFYYAIAFKNLAGGIMVTASHNPKEYNGFKFCREKAIPLGETSGLNQIQNYASEELKIGSTSPKAKITSFDNMVAEYVSQDLSYLNFGKIKRFRIAADPANAMGAMYLEELFSRIPCESIKLNWELNGNMPVHEANPLKLETLEQLQAVIKNEQADFGIATDGDGDRIVFLDEKAQVIPPPIVAGLIAKQLLKKYPSAKIGYDLRSSRIVKEMIIKTGGEPVETPVGHTLIKALMREQNILFAGELSSHYYFQENYNYESPIFVMVELLLLRSELDKPFSEIWQAYQKYFQSGEINFKTPDKQKIIDGLEKRYADGRISKLDGLKVEYNDWWFNIRPSNTEPLLRLNLEANDEELMKQKLEEITALITE